MNVNRIADFAKYPELMWLHRYEQVPAFVLAVICLAVAGWPGLIVGFFWSTVAVYHGTFCINSLAHLVGKRRYVTGDDSRNNWLLAIITMGEGWHNNHHAYQSSARQGFCWWEYDPTFYLLTLLERLGLVWNLKRPTAEVMQNRHKLGSRVISRAAALVADSYYPDRIAAAVAAALGKSGLADLRARLSQAQPFAAVRRHGNLQRIQPASHSNQSRDCGPRSFAARELALDGGYRQQGARAALGGDRRAARDHRGANGLLTAATVPCARRISPRATQPDGCALRIENRVSEETEK